MTGIGIESHIVLCETISGSGDDVTYDSDDEYQFIKSKNPKLGIKFNSKNSHQGYHMSRLSPDIKYIQSVQIPDGKFKVEDLNDITEWITEAFIKKNRIYLLWDFYDGEWKKKSFYDNSNNKVYYLKGLIKNLDIQGEKGKIWKIIFTFEESWL